VEADGQSTYLLFEDSSWDPLSPSTLKSLEKAQQSVAELKDFKAVCLQNSLTGQCATTQSPVNWAAWLTPLTPETLATLTKYDNDSATNAACLQIPQALYQLNRDQQCNAQAHLEAPVKCSVGSLGNFPTREQMAGPFTAMCKSGPGQDNEEGGECGEKLLPLREAMFAKNWDCSTLEAKYTRIALPSAGPLGRSGNCDWWEDEEELEGHLLAMVDPLFQIKSEVEASNRDVTVYFTNSRMTDYYLNKDLTLLGVSVFLVIIVLWVYTSSLFLTFAGLFEILISFPLGLYVWSVVLGEPGVTIIMYNGIFIILGIGCDDIFVFMDAYRQAHEQPSRISGSLETRFAWAFNRSALAMLTTSVTTCLAFGGCAVSQVWDIRCFGIVNGFMVLFDFLLVITWFPACVVFHEKHIKHRCCPACSPRSLFKACVKLCGRGPWREQRNDPAAGDADDDDDAGEAPPVKEHWLEAFYGGPYADFIIKHRKAILALFVFLTGASTVGWILYLKPSTKPFSFFDEDHFVTKTSNIMKNKFETVSSDGMVTVRLGFGVDPKNPWNQGGVHPAELNEDLYENTPQSANYVKGFDLFEHQKGFSTACKSFHTTMVELGESGSPTYFCWIDDFSTWLASTNMNGSFPFADRTQFRTAVDAWVEDNDSNPKASESGNYLHNYEQRQTYSWEVHEEDYAWETGYSFDKSAAMNFAFCGFTTGLEELEDGWPNTRIWKLYDHMQTALEAAEKAGGLVGTGVQVCEEYDFMALASYLAFSAFTSMLASLGIAVLVILLVTRNLRLTVLASLCLYCIVSLVFGLMVLSGWSINLLEAVDISIAGGMSVDYLLHMVHSFNHRKGDSHQKVRGALREMGVSVTMGVVTTFTACCALLATEMLWFRLFGVFIVMVVCSAFFTSMVGLMALLAQMGPSSKNHVSADEGDSKDVLEPGQAPMTQTTKTAGIELGTLNGASSGDSSEFESQPESTPSSRATPRKAEINF